MQGQLEEAIASVWPTAEIAGAPEDADFALIWARPEIALFEDDREGVSLSLDPRDNGVDVDRVREIEKTVPTLLVVNATNPWLLAELEPDARAVAITFEIKPEHLLRSLSGEDGGPAGRLPMAMPVSAQAIADSPRDVPGKFLGDEYAYRDRDGNPDTYGFGLTL